MPKQNTFFQKIIPTTEVIPGYKVNFFHTDNMTVAHWNIKAGAPLPEHAHPQEQIANIISGSFELTIDGITKICKSGSMTIIPANAKHRGRAITDCRIIDVFSPVREDYKNKYPDSRIP